MKKINYFEIGLAVVCFAFYLLLEVGFLGKVVPLVFIFISMFLYTFGTLRIVTGKSLDAYKSELKKSKTKVIEFVISLASGIFIGIVLLSVIFKILEFPGSELQFAFSAVLLIALLSFAFYLVSKKNSIIAKRLIYRIIPAIIIASYFLLST